MSAQAFVGMLTTSHKLLKTTLGVVDEADSGFAPQPALFTVAGHVAYSAGTVDWFLDGAFGDGWNMNFDGHVAEAKAITSLQEAVAWLDRAFERPIDVIGSASHDELFAQIADTRIMAGEPRAAIISGITDHTAHHRGALSVYVRLLGKEPIMPYA